MLLTTLCHPLLSAAHCSLPLTTLCCSLLSATHCSLPLTALCHSLLSATHCSLMTAGLFNPGHSIEVAWFVLRLCRLSPDPDLEGMALAALEVIRSRDPNLITIHSRYHSGRAPLGSRSDPARIPLGSRSDPARIPARIPLGSRIHAGISRAGMGRCARWRVGVYARCTGKTSG
jgi:hypothetical protein